MTEIEAMQVLKRDLKIQKDNKALPDGIEATETAIEALGEIQQYRAIGTVEGYERAIQSSIENYNLYREYKAKVQEFEAIGTIEEFKALKEEVELYRNLDKTNFFDGYNKAIDEFAEKVCDAYHNNSSEFYFGERKYDVLTLDGITEIILEIAEQMKGGVE